MFFFFFLIDDGGQCKYNPCLNAGACTAQPDGYRCSCKVGWFGQNCESKSKTFTGAP